MKRFLSILLAIFFVVSPTIVKAGNYYPTKTTVYYQQGQYYYNSNHDIGTSGAGQEFRTTRSRYVFDLTSVPTNASISNVMLHYSVSDYLLGTEIFKITNITNTSSSSESIVYQNINSTVLFPNILYSSQSDDLSNTNLYNLVMSKRGNYLYLGALSYDEGSSNTYADVDISISFNIVVNITADNNFTA